MVVEVLIETALLCIAYFLLSLSYQKIINKKLNININTLLCLVLISELNIFGAYDTHLIIKFFITIFTVFSIAKFIYNENYENSIILSGIYLLIILISEIIVMIAITPFYNLGYEYVVSASILKGILTVLTTLIVYLAFLIKRIGNIFAKLYLFCLKKIKFFRLLMKLLLIILAFLMFYIIYYIDKHNIFIAVTFFAACFLTIVSTIYSLYKNQTLEYINELLLKNEEDYLNIIETYKMFKHNIVHEFNCIKALGNKKVNILIDEYLDEYKGTNVKYNEISKVPYGLQGVIYQKLIQHDSIDQEIKVDNFFKTEPIKELNTKKIVRLCEGFGIILDNAIEASKKANSYIYIYLNEDSNRYSIKCINKFSASFDIDMIGEKSMSTKDNHMGVGFKYLTKKSKLDINTKIINDKFSVELSIKK